MNSDLYVSSPDASAIAALCRSCAHVIGPLQGCPAIADVTLENGAVLTGKPGLGDPAQWYACIRTDLTPALPENVALCDAELGKAICGVWAS